MKNGMLTVRQFGFGRLFSAVLSGALLLGLVGCSTGSSGGGGNTNANTTIEPTGPATLAGLQGDWQYVRGERRSPLTVDCLTIENARITQFIDHCDGDNILVSSEDITTNGTEAVLRLSIALPSSSGGDPVTINLTATISPNNTEWFGTEEFAPPADVSDPVQYQVGLRRP